MDIAYGVFVLKGLLYLYYYFLLIYINFSEIEFMFYQLPGRSLSLLRVCVCDIPNTGHHILIVFDDNLTT